LEDNRQEHIVRACRRMTEAQQEALCEDIRQIDFPHLAALLERARRPQTAPRAFAPAPVVSFPRTGARAAERRRLEQLGEEYLRRGRVAVFLVAGGQGTRLGFNGPKGCFPVSPIKGKSLFQLFAEQIMALQRRYETVVPWYIMTSRDNHAATAAFFAAHTYFGLDPGCVRLCLQREIPSLDEDGRLIISPEMRIFKNPNGHGGSIQALHDAGALADMAYRGIEELFYFQVDNPLVKIADPLFVGAHVDCRAQMSTKVVRKTDPAERVGVIGLIDGAVGCIEYSELTAEQAHARHPDGTLVFGSANIAVHMLSRAFIEQLATRPDVTLPYHCATKTIRAIDPDTGAERTINGIKFETFIFDALAFTERSCTLEVPREEEFAPVKNKTGPDSPDTARAAMIRLHRSWLDAAGCGSDVPEACPVEISPLFALDRDEFTRKFVPPGSLTPPLYIE